MIEINNIRLRLATEDDAQLLNTWWNDGSVMEHAGFPFGLKQSLQDTLNHIKSYNPTVNPRFIIEIDHVPIGEAAYTIEGRTAYPGWKLCNPNYQNKGYGTTLILGLFHDLFKSGLIDLISWDTMLENKRAQLVYEQKIKARKTAIKDHSWKDQCGNWRTAVYYELTKDEFYKLHPQFSKD